MATPGGPKPGYFPPNNPDTLASNMQNLRINEPNQQQLSNAGGSGAPLPFGQQPLSFPAGQSRPPPPGVLERGPPAPPVAPGQSTLPPDAMPVRPTGPTPVSQPPPFASRSSPPAVLPSSFGGGSSAPPYSGTGPRPGPSGPPIPPQISSNGPAGNGPPAFVPRVMQTGSRPPPPMGNAPRPSAGPTKSPTMSSSRASSQPLQTPGFSSPTAAVSSSVGQPAHPFSAIRQGPLFSGPSHNMPPPPGSLPFPPPPQGTVQSSDHFYGMEMGQQQPPQLIQMRDTMPAVFFFLIDVSMHAIQTGATESACSAISQVIPHLPEGPRTMVGIATFDSSIYFCNLKRALQQPFPDIQDVYTPLESDVVVQLAECRQNLEFLLESIPTMFQNSRITDSEFGATAEAAFLAIKNTGGKLLVFQSIFPSVGIGSLSAREAESRSNISSGDKEPHKLLQPVDKSLTTMAYEFAEYQVSVDLFITTQTHVDIASLSVVPRTTGGQVYYYYPFSALFDPAKLYNDLRWNVMRDAVMRERCSQEELKNMSLKLVEFETSTNAILDEMRQRVDDLAKETSRQRQRAYETEKELRSTREVLVILEEEIQKSDVYIERIEAQLSHLENENMQKEAEIQNLVQKIERLNAQLDKKEALLMAMNEQCKIMAINWNDGANEKTS